MSLLTLTAGAPANGGSCVARGDDGRVVFVRYALPGETVTVRFAEGPKGLVVEDKIEFGDLGKKQQQSSLAHGKTARR